jgi:long-chain fatty acid transport protein
MLLWWAAAYAGSLELLEVGGFWGSPATTEPSAVYWNPGALGAQRGTRFYLEGAPVFATVRFDREDPYWGGRQDYKLATVAPFGAIVTDAGVPGLGFGVGFAIPMARGANPVQEDGPGRTHLRVGDIKAIQVPVGIGYMYKNLFGVGASVSYVLGTWYADLDTSVAPDLYDELDKQTAEVDLSPYEDPSIVENPRYLSRLRFGDLIAHDVTFAVGVHARPHPMLDLSLSYQHGWRADHGGRGQLNFNCPPDTDGSGRFGAETRGLCNTELESDVSVGYRYPAKIRFGVAITPDPNARVEIFGAYTFWRVFTDFEIGIDESTLRFTDGGDVLEETATLVGRDRLWARDNRDSWSLGVDAKYRILDRYRVGVRAGFDRSAVPDEVLSPNNFDGDTLVFGGMFGVAPVKELEIGLGFTEAFVFQRTVTNSAFSQVIPPSERVEGRYFYPSMNGTYSNSIHRVSISLKGQFDGSRRAAKRRSRDALETPDPAGPADPASPVGEGR